jgi:hypothetical protein
MFLLCKVIHRFNAISFEIKWHSKMQGEIPLMFHYKCWKFKKICMLNLILTLWNIYMEWNIACYAINLYNFYILCETMNSKKKLHRKEECHFKAIINNHKICVESMKTWRAKAISFFIPCSIDPFDLGLCSHVTWCERTFLFQLTSLH